MSMKRVKEAPIRHFYENIFYGEDMTSLLVVNQQLGGKDVCLILGRLRFTASKSNSR